MRHVALFALLIATPARAEDTRQVFEQRVMPIFRSPNPSSCVQCHLAGVDLKDYILPSHRDTFVSLRDQGLIDLDDIEKSKILRLIQMGKDDKRANTVHQKNRKREYDAFVAWLKSSAADPQLRNAPKLNPDAPATPPRPVEVIRHARKDRLVESFENNIWSMRFRCMNCHSEGTPQNQKLVTEWGEQVAWFRKGGPEETLDYLMKSKLIDAKQPEKSMLLLKPLNIERHQGGVKFEVGDQGYKAMRSFLEDYARIVGNGYPDAASLPKESPLVSFGTDRWIKLTNTRSEWGDRLLAVQVFAWDDKAKAWEEKPIATADRKVFGKGRLWQHNFTLLAEPGSERARRFKERPALPAGRYLVKVYIDADGKLARDWRASLSEKDFVGEVEVSADWKEGYGAMTVIDGSRVKP